MEINKTKFAINSRLNNNMALKDTTNSTDNEYAYELIEKLKAAENKDEALQILISSDFKSDNYTTFQLGNFVIQNMFSSFGIPYLKNLKKLSSLNLGIIPKYIDTIEKGYDLFLVSQIPNSTTGELVPFRKIKHKIPKENLIQAYKDLQELTKQGIADNDILNGKHWYVTADTKKVILPTWEATRRINENERQQILDKYYNMLFSK